MTMNRTKIKELLVNLHSISTGCNGLFLEEIEELETMLEGEKYKVVVIGEFSSGKSTFLNALIGRETLFSSMRESTGVVTYIEQGPEQMVNVYFDNQEKKSFSLLDESDYKELKTYIDRKRKAMKPSYVGITTPDLHFDEEVVFIDTPGLQGIDETELLITREVIKEANATIVLTTEKGFSGSELDVIAGRHKKFGKIRTKDVFVLVNQIGKVYEGVTEAEGDQQVERIINEVKDGLIKEGLSTIPVFAVDSRDYLWSQDDHLYQTVKQTNEHTTTIIREQDYYLSRSRFAEFKSHLFAFLSADQRSQNFIEDMLEKISYIIEAFEEAFSEQELHEQREKNKQLDILKSQQVLIMDNRRKLYNSLIRAISQSIDTYKEKTETDLKRYLEEHQKSVVPLVNQSFSDKGSLTELNMAALNQQVSGDLNKLRGEIESQLGEYYNTLLAYLIRKTWTEAFQRIFKEKTEVKMGFKSVKVKLDLKWRGVQYEEEENVIRKLKQDHVQTETEIKRLENEKSKLEETIYVAERLNLSNKRNTIEMDYQREKQRLGAMPEPTQKYRTVERTKKKFFIFKETYYDSVPDGLDYTPCNEWKKQQDTIKNRYFRELDQLNQQMVALEESKRLWDKKYQEIGDKQAVLQEIQEDIVEQHRFINRKKQEHEKYFLNEKKMQIVKSFRKVLKEQYENMNQQVGTNLFSLEKNLKDELKLEINQALRTYEESLNRKIHNIEAKITMSSSHIDQILNALSNIKGEIADEL